jgi:hypothetical protein
MTIILYGGTKIQVLEQFACKHKWSEACIDQISRYNKCENCFCVERDCTEQEFYQRSGERDNERNH